MTTYNYTQWSAGVPPVAASTDNATYAAYQAAYQAYSAQSAAVSTASAAAAPYGYPPTLTTQASQPVDHSQGYYQALAAGPYGQPPPLTSATPYAQPAVSTSSTPYAQPPAAPVFVAATAASAATQFGTQYPPSALGLQPHLQQQTPPPPPTAPAPIGTKPTQPVRRGPFEAVSRPRGVPPVGTRPPPIGRGGPGPRNPRPRGSGPGGPGPRGPGPRGPRPFVGGPGFRHRGPRPSFDTDECGEWGGPPPRWDGPPEGWSGPPDSWNGPPEDWNGPPSGWDGGPPGRWNNRSGPPDRWGSPDRWNRDSRDSRSHRDRPSRDRFGRRDSKPPPLMGPDYDMRRNDRHSRKRHRSNSSDRRSKRHVDEDLNVTIVSGKVHMEEGRGGNRYYCTLCEASIRRGNEFQQHLRGKRHRQRMAEQKGEGKDDKSGAANSNAAVATDQDVMLDDTLTLMPLDDPEKIRFYCIICRLTLLTDMNKQAHDCTPSHLKRVKEIEDMKVKAQEGNAICIHCCTIYQDLDKEEHIESEGHKSSLHWRMASCEICTCKFNDITELKKHFQLPKHFKQFEKLKQNGLNPEKMKKYYEDVQAAISEKRTSFCLICTTACGNAENLEIHNMVEARHHDRMRRQAAKAGPDQFYCYCCQRVFEESDRRYHGKSMKHKQAKEDFRRWNCEDCNLTFDQERMLYPHLQCKAHRTMVNRRKTIQRHTILNYRLDWKRRQAEANESIIEQLSKLPKRELPEETDVKEETVEKDDSAEDADASMDMDFTVMPIAGHFCTVCNLFYQFDATKRKICSHVKKAKGIKDKTDAIDDDDEREGSEKGNDDETDAEETTAGGIDESLDQSVVEDVEEGSKNVNDDKINAEETPAGGVDEDLDQSVNKSLGDAQLVGGDETTELEDRELTTEGDEAVEAKEDAEEEGEHADEGEVGAAEHADVQNGSDDGQVIVKDVEQEAITAEGSPVVTAEEPVDSSSSSS